MSEKTYQLDIAETAAAEVITLMGVDTERISAGLFHLHEIWANTIEIGLAIWLLERQMGVACLVPIVIAIGMLEMVVPLPHPTDKVANSCCLGNNEGIKQCRQSSESLDFSDTAASGCYSFYAKMRERAQTIRSNRTRI
jgi:hypothetical protein